MDEDTLAAWYPHPTGPWLRVNAVTSVDGAAEVAGQSGALTDPADQQLLGLLRAQCDALLLGAGTLRAEGYDPPLVDEPRQRWRREHGLPPHPPLVVVSGRLDLDPEWPVFAAAPVRPVVLTHGAAPAGRWARLARVADVVVVGADAVDLPAALAALHSRGLRQLLCEGGPHLFGALTVADLVDEVCLTVSPLLAGPGAGRITAGTGAGGAGTGALRRLVLRHVLTSGSSLFLRYTRHRAGSPHPPDSPVDNAVESAAGPGEGPVDD